MIDISFKTGMHIQKIYNDTFYIDKTMIIDELIDKNGIREKEVVLITRPIIYLDFKNPSVTDFNSMLRSVVKIFRREIRSFLLNSNIDDITKKELLDIKKMNQQLI
ncbi:hypothetical protein OMES3154_00491 [Oceanivirga miroungae]|uniref:AAA-ATPase-like domain-containing protein n=1 Tax=Oceanivirga miroungae TaxID=1130046 RepID=A0A6I8MA70_9FUSO|nr:hypothetical protein OMES3154_00491 [Oceanivirga miroungae]